MTVKQALATIERAVLTPADVARLEAVLERVRADAQRASWLPASVAEREAITARIHAALKEVTSDRSTL